MRNTKNHKNSLGVILGVSTILIALGGLASWWALRSLDVKVVEPDNPPQTIVKPTPISKTVKVYWLNNHANDLELVANPINLELETSATPEEILTTTIKTLLTGPTNTDDYVSTIPETTKLLNLTIKEDGIHINLSQDFTIGGGSAAMTARLGQIIYTATALDPNAAVWLEVEGKPLEFLGGEGLMISQPMTRQDFAENFPVVVNN